MSGIKEFIDKSEIERIFYVGTNYRFNPQFSFYFKGLNLDWENPEHDFEIIDTKNGFELTKNKLDSIQKNDLIIVEKDYINRTDYPSSEQFIPADKKLILKEKGYELYGN
ncbi:MAG: hypothetical protein ABI550_06680 [Ignavibacteriaceae bacterium]